MSADVLRPVQELPVGKMVLQGLFEDEEFPARWDTLESPCDAVAWLRPHELCKEPKLYLEGSSEADVEGSPRAKSRLIGVCVALAERPEYLSKVIPEGQVLHGPGYDGSVRFRFMQSGAWQEVRIDDRLPVDARGRPAYARCAHLDEFWLPLLEKALAKLAKGYDSMHGDPFTALTDLSTSTDRVVDWSAKETFDDIKDALDNNAIIICYAEKELKLSGPFFTISKVFHREEDDLKLIRVRNPRGRGAGEWAGAWKDGDERWNSLDKATRESLQYSPGDDGEFWMELDEFAKAFSSVSIAREKPAEFRTMKLLEKEITFKPEGESEDSDYGVLPEFVPNMQFLMEVESDGKPAGTQPIEVCMELICDLARISAFVFEVPSAREKRFLLKELPALSLVIPNEKGFKGNFKPRILTPGSKYLLLIVSRSEEFPYLLRFYSPNQIRLTELTA